MAKTTGARSARPAGRGTARGGRLSTDEAIIAVLIGAMLANGHVSPREAERAHHIIWFMRRFRNRDGDSVNALIERVRQRIDADGLEPVIERASRAVPSRMRPSIFAVTADLVLEDGRLVGSERDFLARLARRLGVRPAAARSILNAMVVKNSA